MVHNTKLYDLLEVSPEANQEEIKKAYRLLAKQHHPDKNPGADQKKAEEKFKELTEAFSILSDKEKRKVYDLYGTTSPSSSPSSSSSSSRQPTRGKDVVHQLSVTLLQLYRGGTFEISYLRKSLCKMCQGKGTQNQNVEKKTCHVCKGKGAIPFRMMGQNAMIMQQCVNCHGEKMFIPKDQMCQKCYGSGREKKESMEHMKIKIPPNCYNGQKIVFERKGHDDEKLGPGHLVVVLNLVVSKSDSQGNTSPSFRVSEDASDLIMDLEISFFESLFGFSIPIRHLDDRVLFLENTPGQITPHRSTLILEKEGLAMATSRGDLIVNVSVKMPSLQDFSEEQIKTLQSLFDTKPLRGSIRTDTDTDKPELVQFEKRQLSHIDLDNFKQRKQERYEEQMLFLKKEEEENQFQMHSNLEDGPMNVGGCRQM